MFGPCYEVTQEERREVGKEPGCHGENNAAYIVEAL